MKNLSTLVVLLGVILILTGCTGTKHSSKSQSEWGSDHAECEQSIRRELSENPGAYGAADEVRLVRICMQKKGWRK